MSSPNFNAQRYLAENPDVAAAVERGEISAWDHWRLFGQAEGRKAATWDAPDTEVSAIATKATTSPGSPPATTDMSYLQKLILSGTDAIRSRLESGIAAANNLTASDQPMKDLQAKTEAAAERERVKVRRGRGATLLTGVAGLDAGTGSVARRLLTGV